MTDYKTSNNVIDDNSANTTSSVFEIEEDETFSLSDYRFEDWIAFVLFWLLAMTVFAQFLSRYVFESPLGWTEEIARYQLVCLGFIGSCIGVRNNSHIFVSLFHRWLPKQLSHNIYRFIGLCNICFFAALAYFAWQITPLISIHQMASIPVSISVLYSAVFGSLLLLIFRSVQHFIMLIKTEASDKPDDILKSCD
jgi:TRAP-type C4-dicarboxylate transport system permease small subunit